MPSQARLDAPGTLHHGMICGVVRSFGLVHDLEKGCATRIRMRQISF